MLPARGNALNARSNQALPACFVLRVVRCAANAWFDKVVWLSTGFSVRVGTLTMLLARLGSTVSAPVHPKYET